MNGFLQAALNRATRKKTWEEDVETPIKTTLIEDGFYTTLFTKKSIVMPVKTALLTFIFWGLSTLYIKAQAYVDTASFLRSITIQSLPFKDSISNYPSATTLSAKQKEALALESAIPARNLMPIEVNLLYKLDLSNEYITLVFGYVWHGAPHHTLVNYTKTCKPIASVDLAYTNNSGQFQKCESLITQRDVAISQHYQPSSTRYNRFLFGHDGSIVPKVYKSLTELKHTGKLADVRTVKARNGLIAWNKQAKALDTIVYGADIYIITYQKHPAHSKDRTALIALDFFRYLDDLLVPSDSSNYAYVNESDLYRSGGFFASYAATGNDAEPATRFYYTHAITLKNAWEAVTDMDIRELLTIEKVNLEAYRKKISITETAPNPFNFPYLPKPFTLQLKNGERLRYKDSTYEGMEYAPTNHFQLVTHSSFKDHYLIYTSFFEDSRFLLLSKQNGDTSAIFQGYPFVSPNGTYVVSLKTPYTYGKGEAQLEIQTRVGQTYRFALNAFFAFWNLPNQLTIFWLAENEFILKVKDVEDAFSDEEEAHFFHLKFTISENL